MIVVISCGLRKLRQPAPAMHLYTGNIFRTQLDYAMSLAPLSRVFIISAKHGLVRLTTVLAPYDMRITDPGAITSDEIRRQAEDLGIIDEADVVTTANRHYTALMREVWPEIRAPFTSGYSRFANNQIDKSKKRMNAYRRMVP